MANPRARKGRKIPTQNGAAANPGSSHKTGQRKIREVVRNRHGNDKEAVFDDGEQVLNDASKPQKGFRAKLQESLTTGAIAIAPASSLKGKSSMASHKMDQPGKPIGGRNVTKDNTGNTSTSMKDHGDPFGKKQKNTGGQFEKLEGGKHEGTMGESMSIRDIADTIQDDGVSLQSLFDSYARSVQYVALREFREIAESYGCNCQDEATLMRLMTTNSQFMFMEGQDGGGRYWVPRLMTEGEVPEAFKKNWKNGEGESDSFGGDNGGEDGGEKKEKKKSKKPWEKEETVDEAFQHQSPDEHFGRHRDPGYDQAESMDDIPFFDDDSVNDEFGGGMDGEFGGGMGGEFGDEGMEGSATRGGDTFAGRESADMGAGSCPECRAPLDELGCPECGFTPDEFEQDRFDDPSDIASNNDQMDQFMGSARGGLDNDLMDVENQSGEDLMDLHGMGDEYGDEEPDDRFYESRNRRGMLSEDGHKMDSPAGKGVEAKTSNKKSGLPQEKTDTTDMGKAWPRKQKNTGGMWEEFGNSKHAEASDGIQTHHSELNLKTKQKNTGGQWETFEGGQHAGKMGGGATKMHESVNMLNRHVRQTLAREVQTNKRLYSESGKYPLMFMVSASDQVRPRIHNNLMEALVDAEELLQVYGADNVSFEARFCDSDGSVLARKLIPMINVHARGPIVAEGKRILFRFPEIAQDYADRIVSEGKSCRAVTDNWGASVTASIDFKRATAIFRNLVESGKS